MLTAQQVVPRAEIARQAVQGNPWTFVQTYTPILARGSSPEIADELRVFLAHNLLRLGLRTPATQLLDQLSAPAKRQPGVMDAVRNAQRMPADMIDAPLRVEFCRSNLAAIADRSRQPADLDARFRDWERAADQIQAFRTNTGVPVLRRLIGETWVWTHFADQNAIVASFKSFQIAPGPLYVDGLHAPLALNKLVEMAARTPLGLEPSITLLVASETELLDALSLADLRPVLSQERVRLYVGPDAPNQLSRDLHADLDRNLGVMVSLPCPPPTPERFTQESVTSILKEVGARQLQEQDLVASRLAVRDATRSKQWWADRYANPGDRPLRVIIPTTRFSSFLKHSAADMADAMRALGWDAKVLVEPDERGNLSALGYARQIEAFDPDLIILLNATRSLFYGILPPGIPVATWIQDAMPHLFDKKVGAAMGERDFVVGHTYFELFRDFGYPSQRLLHTPVVAGESKFNTEPVAAELLRKHECEIAYVSHHSQTPRELADRFIREASAGSNAWIAKFVAAEFDRICELGRRGNADGYIDSELRLLVQGSLEKIFGREPDSKEFSLAYFSAAIPLAERACRHQMVEWAARIAKRRGWRFNLFGRGWEARPELACFAKGEIPHDDELKASYQAATVHLHGSITGFLHQRVIECALAGGLPLVRFNADSIGIIGDQVGRRLTLERVQPWISWIPDRSAWINGTDHPDCARYVSMQQRLGVAVVPGVRFYPELLSPEATADRAMVLPRGAIWLLGDAAESTFDSEASLEAAVERALTSPAWKRELAAGIRARASEALTYRAVLRRLAEQISTELASSCAQAPATREAA